jgi:hypothetical protein
MLEELEAVKEVGRIWRFLEVVRGGFWKLEYR